MRSRNGLRAGLWSPVLSILLLVAGGAFLVYLGTIIGPSGGRSIAYAQGETFAAPLKRELTTLVQSAQKPKLHAVAEKTPLAVGTSQLVGEHNQLGRTSVVRKHGAMCGLQDSQIEEILLQEHGSKPWEKRYSWDYRWWDINTLTQYFYDNPAKDVECLLLSASGVLPCLHEECLLTLYIRPRTSDIRVALQLFDKLEYYYLDQYTPKTILDAGGNVGFGALIFGTMFPDATVITIEPDSDNYRMLRQNTKHLANVIPLRAGLWWKVTALRIREKYKDGGHEWEYVVEEVTKADVAAKTASTEPLDFFPAVTVDYLVQLFNLGSFDMAKIDIEGSEREVFTQETFNRLSWVPKVKLLTMELHETLKPGAEAAVGKALSETFGGVFEVVTRPEYQIWTNKQTIGEITNKVVESTNKVVESAVEIAQSSPLETGPVKGAALDTDPLEGLVSN